MGRRPFRSGVIVAVLAGSVLWPCVAPAAPNERTTLFAVVVTRHGVRSLTREPAEYAWPDWSPVAPGFLTAHGYRLMTYLGRFYRGYFASLGIPLGCSAQTGFVYADLDQRTLETGRALIEGACGTPGAIPLQHAATGSADPLFDGADWLIPAGRVDSAASRTAVTAAAPVPPSALVAEHAADFADLQALLAPRCADTCPPVTAGASSIVATKGLAKLLGPLDRASGDAESLFLEDAECGPALDPQRLAGAMRLHVLDYDVNARTTYNASIRGSNIFAHIVGLLEQHAGFAHPDVDVPDLAHVNVAILSGHDTQLGALGGLLDAHWAPGGGLAADDMPPGGALIFELYRTSAGEERVRLRFAYETLAQLRTSSALADGVALSPVRLRGCDGDDCSVSLAQLGARAHALAGAGFVQRAWTASDAPIALAPLVDPNWMRCSP
jgi:4-phytase/acid phosphatase